MSNSNKNDDNKSSFFAQLINACDMHYMYTTVEYNQGM